MVYCGKELYGMGIVIFILEMGKLREEVVWLGVIREVVGCDFKLGFGVFVFGYYIIVFLK